MNICRQYSWEVEGNLSKVGRCDHDCMVFVVQLKIKDPRMKVDAIDGKLIST